jgi:RNA polymerase sigma-70 factor, ECF subfamily
MEFAESHKHINEWARKFASGDARSAEQLFDYFYPIIFRYIKYRLRNNENSEDVTQEVFLKVARKIQQFDKDHGNFSAWIWQIARNTLIDHVRSKARQPEDSASSRELDLDSYTDVHSSSLGQITSEAQDLKKVAEILKKYHPEDQELFRMKYIAGLEYQEIAKITGRSINAITVATHRIREKVKKDIYEQTN